MSDPRQLRAGFTMVELLVVMMVMLFIASITVLILPTLQDNIKVATAAERLQGWLLNAKQIAKRDGTPTGVRLLFDSMGQCKQLLYVQQPADHSQGRYTGPDPMSNTTAVFSSDAGIAPASSSPAFSVAPNLYAVQQGDFLEIFGEPVRMVGATPSAGATQLNLISTTTPLNPTTYAATGPANYRIIRMARPLPSEQPLQLPTDTMINVSSSLITPTPAPPAVDILFAPSGTVMDRTGTLICLRVGDVNEGVSGTGQIAAPTVIAITTRTGFIAAHPIAPGADPFAFARDARDSGL